MRYLRSLHALMNDDVRSRAILYLICLVSFTATGTLAQVVWAVPKADAYSISAVVMLLVWMLFWVWYTSRNEPKVGNSSRSDRRMSITSIAAGIAALFLVSRRADGVITPRVVEAKLRSAVAREDPGSAANALEAARGAGIAISQVSADTVSRLMRMLKPEVARGGISLRLARRIAVERALDRKVQQTFPVSIPAEQLMGGRYQYVVGKSLPRAYASEKLVPPAVGAIMNWMPNPLVEKRPEIPEALMLVGGAISLDDFRFRNVFFVDMEIVYNGFAVALDNCHFVRCAFANDLSGPYLGEFFEKIVDEDAVTMVHGSPYRPRLPGEQPVN